MQLPFSQEDIDAHRAGTPNFHQTELDKFNKYYDERGSAGRGSQGNYSTDNGMLQNIGDYTRGILSQGIYSRAILDRISLQLANISASLENISNQLASGPGNPGQPSRQNERATSPSPDAGLGQQKPSGRVDSNSSEIVPNWVVTEDSGNDEITPNWY